MKELAIEFLKLRAKSLGITQEALSKGLGVSLPTVKRWYGGKGLTIANLKAMCDYLGCSMSEVFSSVENSDDSSFVYTLSQENAFVREPRLLAFFDHLVRRKSLPAIKGKFKLAEHELTSMLLKLDKLGLIELHPGNKVKLTNQGEPSWIPGGPLSQRFRKEILDDFTGVHEKEETTFYLHEYLDEDLETIRSKLRDLESFLKMANKRTGKGPKESVASIFRCPRIASLD